MARKLPITINEEEFLKLLKATKKPHYRTAFALGFYAGLRVSEVVKLKKEDVDREQKLIRIKSGKGNKDRNVPINPKIIRGLNSIPVGVGVRALQIAFKKKAIKVLGRDDLHFHSLRHSCATHYLKKGWSSFMVQRLLGHSRISTTEIYTHVSQDDMIEKMWGGN